MRSSICSTLVVISVFVVSGCAAMYGTPAERAAKASAMSSYQLCEKLAVATLAPDEIRATWARELDSRNETCQAYAGLLQARQQQNQALMLQGLKLMQQGQPRPLYTSPPVGGGSAVGMAFLKGQYVSGVNRICMYDRLGSAVSITVSSTQICPLSLP